MIKVRAEENALLIWNREQARTSYISGEELLALSHWTEGESNGFSGRLKILGIISDSDVPAIKEAIYESSHVDMKEKSDSIPYLWNNSSHLNMFRMINDKIGEPCKSCHNLSGCCGCRAVMLGHGQDFYGADKACPFFRNPYLFAPLDNT